MTRVLVTGATGRLGATAVARLAEEGLEVVPVGSRDVDLADVRATEALIERAAPDAILHLAGLRDGPDDRLMAVNAGSTRTVARAAAARRIRFVFTSSAAVYGDRRRAPLAETDPLDPGGPYARSKVAAESEIPHDADAVVLRVFNVTGPKFHSSLPVRLLTSRASEPVPLVGMDGFVRDYVHSDDVADAMVAALRLPRRSTPLVLNVGTGVGVSNAELVRVLAARRPVHWTVSGDIVSWSVADPARASAELGWSARRRLDALL